MKKIILVALIGLSLSGCSFLSRFGGIFIPNRHNDFAEANLRIKAKEVEYTKHWNMVVNPDTSEPREGVMTLAQYRKFQALEDNVISATKVLYDIDPITKQPVGDIAVWRKTNTKPADYEAHEKTLFTAIDEFIKYVKTEAVKL